MKCVTVLVYNSLCLAVRRRGGALNSTKLLPRLLTTVAVPLVIQKMHPCNKLWLGKRGMCGISGHPIMITDSRVQHCRQVLLHYMVACKEAVWFFLLPPSFVDAGRWWCMQIELMHSLLFTLRPCETFIVRNSFLNVAEKSSFKLKKKSWKLF